MYPLLPTFSYSGEATIACWGIRTFRILAFRTPSCWMFWPSLCLDVLYLFGVSYPTSLISLVVHETAQLLTRIHAPGCRKLNHRNHMLKFRLLFFLDAHAQVVTLRSLIEPPTYVNFVSSSERNWDTHVHLLILLTLTDRRPISWPILYTGLESPSSATQAKSCRRSYWTDWSRKRRRSLLKNRQA